MTKQSIMTQTAGPEPCDLQALWDNWKSSNELRYRDELVTYYTPWLNQIVTSIYRKHRYELAEWSDYFSLAVIGLISALSRYDMRHNVPFEAYAFHRVKGAILNGLVAFTSDSMCYPTDRSDEQLIEQSIENFTSSADPFIKVIDAAIGFALGSFLELGIFVHETTDSSPEAQYHEQRQEKLLFGLLSKLSTREEFILRQHYMKGIELREIAVSLGVSAPRVTQLHHQALRKLRKLYEEQAL